MPKVVQKLHELVTPENEGEPLASKKDVEDLKTHLDGQLTIIKRLIQSYGARR